VTAPPALDPSPVRAIVFDLDGTLVDSYRPITTSLNYTRAQFGMLPLGLAEIRSRVGRGLEHLIGELVGPDRVEQGVQLFRRRYSEIYADQTVGLPGVVKTLRGLREAGYSMAVASNKPTRFSQPILQRVGMLPFIGCVQGPDLVAAAKPEPAMILRCLELLHVTRCEAVYVGDMLLDVESAARAGLPVILVPGGSSNRQELRGTGQTLLSSFEALLALLPGPPTGPRDRANQSG
jgi:phosphoglycolate phosphatase